MSLSKLAYSIQYQTARLEAALILNSLIRGKSSIKELDPSCRQFSALISILFEAAEDCIKSSDKDMNLNAKNLQIALTSNIKCLNAINESLTSTESVILLMTELTKSVASELLILRDELSEIEFRSGERSSSSSNHTNDSKESSGFLLSLSPSSVKIENKITKLIRKCMGDASQAERLIQYEIQRKPDLSRDEAIQAAIESWERDHR